MADAGIRFGGLSSGLALILNGEDGKDNFMKNRLVSYCDDFGNQPLERALEYIFGLPYKTLSPLTGLVDKNLVHSIIKNDFLKFHVNSNNLATDRDGICILNSGCPSHKVGLEVLSRCGDIRIIRPPLFLVSLAMFNSMRANVCVWKGKWMYELFNLLEADAGSREYVALGPQMSFMMEVFRVQPPHDFYMKCMEIVSAQKVFDEMLVRNVAIGPWSEFLNHMFEILNHMFENL